MGPLEPEIPTPTTPFANGTEGGAWMGAWCSYCAHDHGIHADNGPGCSIITDAVCFSLATSDPWRWPEAWLPEPDDGLSFLPSRMVCGMFTPCEPCGGDPGAEERAERVAEVTAYWAGRR